MLEPHRRPFARRATLACPRVPPEGAESGGTPGIRIFDGEREEHVAQAVRSVAVPCDSEPCGPAGLLRHLLIISLAACAGSGAPD